MKIILPIVLTLTSASLYAQTAARVVEYRAHDIVPVHGKMYYTTLIELPATEKIIQTVGGNTVFWIAESMGNYCFVHPAKPGIQSNLNLITERGNIYSFTLDENQDQPDLALVIHPSDQSAVYAATGPVKYVPADELTAARLQLANEQSKAAAATDQKLAAAQEAMQFNYDFKTTDKTFPGLAIWQDGKFTYIRSTAPEKFAVYEEKDGKPNLITYDLAGNTYTINHVVDKGWLQIGKKKLTFARKG